MRTNILVGVLQQRLATIGQKVEIVDGALDINNLPIPPGIYTFVNLTSGDAPCLVIKNNKDRYSVSPSMVGPDDFDENDLSGDDVNYPIIDDPDQDFSSDNYGSILTPTRPPIEYSISIRVRIQESPLALLGHFLDYPKDPSPMMVDDIITHPSLEGNYVVTGITTPVLDGTIGQWVAYIKEQ